jgi:hypothetical protein
MLPLATDLPGEGWRVTRQRTWRTGRLGPRSDTGDRAAAAGCVTAWRSFENAAHDQWLWVQINPMATEDDARISLEISSKSGMRNPRAKATFLKEVRRQAPSVPGIDSSWALEHHVSSSRGQHVIKLMGASVGRIVFRLQGSGWTDWTWDEVGVVAEAVASRIGSAGGDGS